MRKGHGKLAALTMAEVGTLVKAIFESPMHRHTAVSCVAHLHFFKQS